MTDPADAPVADPLATAERALSAGDFRTCRALATPFATSADPVVSARARALLGALGTDPVVTGAMLFTAVLIAALIALYVLHGA